MNEIIEMQAKITQWESDEIEIKFNCGIDFFYCSNGSNNSFIDGHGMAKHLN